jgi:hypothetical protein
MQIVHVLTLYTNERRQKKNIGITSLVIHSEGLNIDVGIIKISHVITSNWVQIIPL